MERIDQPINEPKSSEISKEEKQMAMFCHLGGLAGFVVPFGSFIVPLIIWSMKKDEMPFVNDQGKEALNFQITMAIAMIIFAILCIIIIGVFFLLGLVMLQLALVVIASIKVSEGRTYRYPFTIRFVS